MASSTRIQTRSLPATTVRAMSAPSPSAAPGKVLVVEVHRAEKLRKVQMFGSQVSHSHAKLPSRRRS